MPKIQSINKYSSENIEVLEGACGDYLLANTRDAIVGADAVHGTVEAQRIVIAHNGFELAICAQGTPWVSSLCDYITRSRQRHIGPVV